ncbi:hypothetical protein Aspvir_002691 [Aspergillus viridinutans]|uniref:Uncharacterized protein n=1 Tax=Aspergillus viridinutans TaxID=75553 RepID=A0A9P3C6D8_ASPVI|nr:uncharacterized protein Aspvir_002691 [Aspergillus viridinutans]GIK07038.1 hypothetical protein Aspvir_002691 [Aspergillus viridinutans]
MPEILLPDTASITSSTASSDHQQASLTRRKSLPLRRLSVWLSRRISRQGLNATYDSNYTHANTHTHNDNDRQKIISDLNHRKRKEYEAERDLSEAYAAYCRAFTSAGQHLHHQNRRTWMMDGEVDLTMISEDSRYAHPEDDEEGVLDEKRVPLPAEPEAVLSPVPELEPSPPPHILTPSLYVEMRRAACDKKRARQRLRQRRLWSWSWSWFSHIRHRESH